MAGPITGRTIDEATDWRDYAADVLASHGIEAYSPMRGKDYLRKYVGNGVLGAGDDTAGRELFSTPKAIVARDRFDVMTSDVVLFNLGDADRVSIGTMVELGWADSFRKLKVIVSPEGDHPHDHGFVREMADFLVGSLDEALHVIVGIGKRRAE